MMTVGGFDADIITHALSAQIGLLYCTTVCACAGRDDAAFRFVALAPAALALTLLVIMARDARHKELRLTPLHAALGGAPAAMQFALLFPAGGAPLYINLVVAAALVSAALLQRNYSLCAMVVLGAGCVSSLHHAYALSVGAGLGLVGCVWYTVGIWRQEQELARDTRDMPRRVARCLILQFQSAFLLGRAWARADVSNVLFFWLSFCAALLFLTASVRWRWLKACLSACGRAHAQVYSDTRPSLLGHASKSTDIL